VILVGAGQQSYIKISPIAEGISNFFVSVVLGSFLGGRGVALGTLFGSFISIGAHLSYSMKRTKSAIDFSRTRFLISGILVPFLVTLPLSIVAAFSLLGVRLPMLAVALAIFLALAAACFFIPESRDFIEKWLGIRSHGKDVVSRNP
jgi:O-antigen/teichoic acid export membrane protein